MTTEDRLSGLLMALGSIMLIASISYITYVAVQGEYGIFRRMALEAQEELLRRDLTSLEEERAVIENRTRRLSTRYLDLDLLDEQARKVLGMARGDEIVIH